MPFLDDAASSIVGWAHGLGPPRRVRVLEVAEAVDVYGDNIVANHAVYAHSLGNCVLFAEYVAPTFTSSRTFIA